MCGANISIMQQNIYYTTAAHKKTLATPKETKEIDPFYILDNEKVALYIQSKIFTIMAGSYIRRNRFTGDNI